MKNLIRKILKEETEVYHIFEDSDFDPFGHITDQSEEETELEELGFDLNRVALFFTSSWLYLSFCYRV
jgi:hypothetical protein